MLTSGSGEADLLAANDPKLFTDPVSLSYSDLNVTPRRRVEVAAARGVRRGRRRRHLDGRGALPVAAERRRDRRAGRDHARSRRRPPGSGHGSRCGRRRDRRGLRLPAPAPRRRHPEGAVRDARDAAGAGAGADRAAEPVPDGRHAQGRLARLRLPLPGRRIRPGAELLRPAGERGRRRDALPDPARRARRQRRRGRDRLVAGIARSTRGCSARRTRTTSRATPARR